MQQVLLARPELSSQVSLPDVPPQAQGLTNVLANMALLARDLNDQNIDANSFLSQGSDAGLTSLIGSASGRRLLQVVPFVLPSCMHALYLLDVQMDVQNLNMFLLAWI